MNVDNQTWGNESVFQPPSTGPKVDPVTNYYKSEYLFSTRFVVDDTKNYHGPSCNMAYNSRNYYYMSGVGGFNRNYPQYGVVYWLNPAGGGYYVGYGTGRLNASFGWDTINDSKFPPVPSYDSQNNTFYIGIVLSESTTTLKEGISRYYYFTNQGLYGCRVLDGNTGPASLLTPWINAGETPIHIGCYYNDLFYASASVISVVTVNPDNQNVNQTPILPPFGHTYKDVYYDDTEFVCTTENLNTWMYINGNRKPFYSTAPISSNLTLTPYALNFNGFKLITDGDSMTMKDSDNQPIMTITKGLGIKFNYPIIS
jgi:hypothetical protein